MTDKLEVTQAEYGRIHTDGSRSGGQPPRSDLVERVTDVVRNQLMSTDYPVSDYERDFTAAILAAIPDTAALVAQLTATSAKIGALTAAGEKLAAFASTHERHAIYAKQALIEWKEMTR